MVPLDVAPLWGGKCSSRGVIVMAISLWQRHPNFATRRAVVAISQKLTGSASFTYRSACV